MVSKICNIYKIHLFSLRNDLKYNIHHNDNLKK